MVSTWNEYQKKIIEIDKYYNYIKQGEANFPSDLYKILKANLFLMLYNLVESTVRNSLEEIHNAIINENLDYKNCIDHVKALWVEFNYKKFNQKKASTIIEIINNIDLDKVNIDYSEYLKVKTNDISGNIDGLKIRNLAQKYSFSQNQRVAGHNLVTIKNARNRLAHGEASFSEIGQSYEINDLDKFRKECRIYLKEFLLNIEKYINEKQFKQ